MKTLLLTGGTGYIGSHTAVLLLEHGYNVVLLDNLSNSSDDVVEKIQKITGKKPLFYQGDIRDKNILKDIFSENTIDTVIHFAGAKAVGESCENPFEYYENNVVGTIHLTEVMEEFGVRNIIFSSSATVYDPNQTPPFSENTLTGNTTNPYGTTKFIIENILRDLSNHKGFKVANLRYFNPIGAHSSGLIGEDPNDIPNNLLPYIMKVASGELPELSVFGDDYDTIDGTGVRDYIHVVDLAHGHIKALTWLERNTPPVASDIPLDEGEHKSLLRRGRWANEVRSEGAAIEGATAKETGFFEIFNLGTGKGTSVLEMIEYTEDIIGEKLPYKVLGRRTGDIASAYCSPQKAEKILGWKAQKTVKQAIEDSWKFIKNKQGK